MRLHSPFMLLALVIAAGSGLTIVVLNPSRGAEALGPLALVQMFAASSGFAVPARRGHLDLLLTGGTPRWLIALTHFAVSVVPGLLAWIVVTAVEMAVGRTLAPKGLSSGTIVAFAVISALAWALTVRLPRLSGAIAWLLAMAVWFVGAPDVPAALVVMLCPFVLLGGRLAGDQLDAALPIVAVAALLTAFAMTWIVRTDVPLESAQ